MSRPTALPFVIKALGLVVILGGALYGTHAWLNARQAGEAANRPSVPDTPGTTAPTSGPTATTVSGRLDARDVAKAYASDRQAANTRFKDQRLQIHGVVNGIEPGQGQILLITLGADDAHPGLRAVVDGAAQAAARQATVGQPLGLDCLNQGLLLDEPVLSDCRVLP